MPKEVPQLFEKIRGTTGGGRAMATSYGHLIIKHHML